MEKEGLSLGPAHCSVQMPDYPHRLSGRTEPKEGTIREERKPKKVGEREAA